MSKEGSRKVVNIITECTYCLLYMYMYVKEQHGNMSHTVWPTLCTTEHTYINEVDAMLY